LINTKGCVKYGRNERRKYTEKTNVEEENQK
jgi:hypothetical protein